MTWVNHVILELRQSPISQSHLYYRRHIQTVFQHTLSLSFKMSVGSSSTQTLRGALLRARLASPVSLVAKSCTRTVRPVAFGSLRNASSSARLSTLTASETRRRPTARQYQQPMAQSRVNGPSPANKRTIFIQTENTPNPDVSLQLSFHSQKQLLMSQSAAGSEVHSKSPRSSREFPNHLP